MLTSHAYGLNQCITDPTIPQYPSVANLLSVTASRGLLTGVAPYIALAHRNGATYRIDEMGSVSCNGRTGVSDSMASALWVLDTLCSFAASQIDGVNLHSFPNSVNGLFDFTRVGGSWKGVVYPLYYGAMMFAQAAPSGSRLLAIGSAAQDQLRAWATLAPDGRVRVLLINDGLSSSADALVHAPLGFGSHAGTLERLLAPSASATSGITLGGQRFGDTTTGVLPAPVLATAKRHGATYTVRLPAASAALLTLSPR
jgi:hypothetical protein